MDYLKNLPKGGVPELMEAVDELTILRDSIQELRNKRVLSSLSADRINGVINGQIIYFQQCIGCILWYTPKQTPQ